MKGNSKEWFDSVVSEGITNRSKRLKKFMKSIRPVDREMFMSGRYELKKLVAEKKRIYFEVELTNLQICDLSVILGTFLNLCKLAKLKPLFEKRFGLEKNVHDQTSD